ncbi:unnamed protein product [Phaedon cochleariae]|uniref:Coiled-coil domain-containing protein 93 n=1 Tax=Phaedon cochleariae TaxID=80249 RepID=A0A9N9SLJ2_PHACE|nr:unnamed protein product [Phaedon cochleariae]
MTTVNPEVFKKFKNATLITSRQEGDGHEVQVEVREDEEQSVKLQEITDILVAAGYFRARIKGLSSFDKVVGGMVWCIESCNVDIDVDLLFQENSTIGQKIALTEKIVAVLPKIKCPHRIEPHQIQGLDFIHIFPVIQWLVKRSMEFRQEMSASVRSYAVNQFSKQFEVKDKNEDVNKKMLSNLQTVKEIYRPRRYYKRKNAPPQDMNSRVQITLLEYDHHGRDLQGTSTSAATSESGVLETEQAEKQIQHLLNNLTIAPEDSFDCDELSEEEKKNLMKHYELLQSELKDGGVTSREETQTLALEQQLQLLSDRCSELKNRKSALQEKLKNNEAVIEETQLKQKEANRILKELENEEIQDPDTVKEIEEMIILNDNLKTQEIQFRSDCKKELARLQNLIQETKSMKARTPAETNLDLGKEINEEQEKIRVLRLQVAKKNRHVAALQRQLDDVPNRAELAQYQKRFLELYNQVASKHKETKQYYTLYNTLEDTRLYMKKELSLLNSVSENYPEAVQSSSNKEEFLNQFQGIVDSVRQSKMKVEQKVIEEKHKRDELCNNLQGLIELQRKYVAAVRHLGVEFRKQEILIAQIHGQG